MNKTAIKNFAVWARNKLIADISYRAGLIGITESGIASALPQSTGTTEFYDIGTAEPYSISGDAVRQRRRLVELIERKEKETDYKTAYISIIEEVAYTWFNRLIAIRFMEVNDYLPPHIRVLSSESGKIEPDLVTTPFDAELEFSNEEECYIYTLKQDNQLDELFRYLFIKQCNELNNILPALFEKTTDYMELLLNISVTDHEGIVYHLLHDIPEEDFDIERGGQIEIIGWLYQFYIAEPKDELINARKKYNKEDIPFVTQLFTSDWIVKYLVDNSLGRMWIDGHPNSEVKDKLEYYLEETKQDDVDIKERENARLQYQNLEPDKIKIIDPCMGSGHILVYAFDVLMQIYESMGYSQRDAAKSILENNIYGLDIDDRAFQMAYFSVLMKARQYNRRILTEDYTCNIVPIKESKNVNRLHLDYMGKNMIPSDRAQAKKSLLELLDTFEDAKEFGAIIDVETYEWELLDRFLDDIENGGQLSFDLLGIEDTQSELHNIIKAGRILSQQYDVAITNPPYMNSSYMPDKLKQYVSKEYSDFKGDMFAVFTNKVVRMCKQNGQIGLLMPYVWMFISSYEKMRIWLNQNATISSLVQLEYNAFEAACVPVAALTLIKNIKVCIGEYIRLSDFRGAENQGPKTLEAVKNVNCGYRFSASQSKFEKIPGMPIAYWIGEQTTKSFEHPKLEEYAVPLVGMFTTDNNKYLRLHWEVDINDIGFGFGSKEEAYASTKRYFPYNKGGGFRRWYGNAEYVVKYENAGEELKQLVCAKYPYLKGNYDFVLKTQNPFFEEGITWSDVGIGDFACRYTEKGYMFDVKGSSMFPEKDKLFYLIGFLNSKYVSYIMNVLNPTMSFQVGNIKSLPVIIDGAKNERLNSIVKQNIELSKQDWDSFETSWDFATHPFIKISKELRNTGKSEILLEEVFAKWDKECEERFSKIKSNEEELNQIFIDIYNLKNELTPEVKEDCVTVRKADKDREVRSLISYAVGCMLGRYSLDKEGVAYAGGKWDEEQYAIYLPDKDNCIPITDEEYFEDDIVGRFCEWIKIVFGPENIEKNLDYIANILNNKGATSREVIRNYFMKEFVKDHLKTYQKRPIYWMFDSGKQGGFKALIYMHRYDQNTVGNLRVDYLHRIQRIYESEINRMQDMIEHSTVNREVAASTKRKEKLQKQLKECREYDEKVSHLALARIAINLDDGVKANYEKVQTGSDGKRYQIMVKLP